MLTKQLEFNKKYTWEEIVDAYPNKYVFLTDVDYNKNGDIVSATLLNAASFEDREIVYQQVRSKISNFIVLMTVYTGTMLGVLNANVLKDKIIQEFLTLNLLTK